MITVQNLSKSFFAGNQTLQDLSFEIPKNKFVVLVGPSGSGKSTLLRIIAGLEAASGGKIFIDGKDVTNTEPKKRNLGMVFQNYALYPHFTVEENLSYPLKIKKIAKSEIKKIVQNTAEILEISDILKLYPKSISGGQKQRVAIGRCIVRQLDIFLFDEPLSNLDARLRESLRRQIASLQKKLGKTFVYVTHDQVEAMALGEVIIVLNKGKIQQIGSPKQIYQKPSNLFTAEFIGSPMINKFTGKNDQNKFVVNNTQVIFDLPEKLKTNVNLNYACVRPEKIKIKPLETTSGNKLVLELIHIEYLGSKNLLEFSFGDRKILAETSTSDPGWKIGENYIVDFDLSDILWFDSDGLAL